MLKFLRNKAGYGLIETIISICVLSTITITSMTLLTNMMSSLEFFRSNVVAQTLATSKVNLLSVADYASVANEARAQVDSTYKLDRELLVNEVDLGGGNKKKDITINIYKTGAADTLFTMNYTLASAGAVVVVPHGKQLFTANGTFTVPAGVTTIWVNMSGGGGGGAGGANQSVIMGGGGGAAAAYYEKALTVTPNETIAITIGAGGASGVTSSYGNTRGGNGGTTSFGAYLSCAGGGGAGTGALYSCSTPGASGGSGGTSGAAAGNGGNGGNTLFGMGGLNGGNGTGYGAGGGGAVNEWNNGGAGASGFVLVEW